MEDKKIFDSADAAALGLLLKPPQYGCECNDKLYNNKLYDESWLLWLLEQYGSIQAAAYAGCLMLAEDSACRLPDGTTLPDLQNYWLRMAKLYRPNGGRCVQRADDTSCAVRGNHYEFL